MRRIVVVAILLLMMLALNALKVPGDVLGNPLMLSAIGFILLAAFSVAELGAEWTLPRVTGYILAGILLGPQVGNILTGNVVVEMRMFNTLALGLIALSAGLELELAALRRVGRTLAATLTLKVLLLIGFVGFGFYGFEKFMHILPADGEIVLICLCGLMAALAIATSPATTIAVLTETRARGRLSELVLGAAVLKDVLVVVVLAIVISICKAMLADTGTLEMSTLRTVGVELVGSVLAGTILGGLLIAYLKWVRAEMLLFVAASILAVAEVSQALHLELLLVFITSGFVVRNFSSFGESLHHPLERVSLPVFVVFFTIAGAGLDLIQVYEFLPLILALFSLRAIAFFLAAKWGSRLGGEPPEVQRYAWLGYLPQAGVTVGLVGLTAKALPEIGDRIEAIGLSVVALNLLVGPIAFRLALKWAGEIPENATPATEASEEEKPQSSPMLQIPRITQEQGRELLEQLGSDRVRTLIDQLRQRLHERLDSVIGEVQQPALEVLRLEAEKFLSSWQHTEAHFQGALHFLKNGFQHATKVGEKTTYLREDFQKELMELEQEIALPLEKRHTEPQPGDTRFIRWEKFWLRLAFKLTGPKDRRRNVPVRLAGRLALEESLVLLVGEIHNRWYQLHCRVLEELRRVVAGKTAEKAATQTIDALVNEWKTQLEEDLDAVFFAQLDELATYLGNSGTVYLPPWKLRLSDSEPKVRRAVRELQSDRSEWVTKLKAVKSTFRVALLAEYIEKEAIRIITHKYFKPVENTSGSIQEELERVRSQLASYRTRIEENEAVEGHLRGLHEEVQKWADQYFGSQRRFRKTHINHFLLNREIALMFNLVLPKDVEHFMIVSSETPSFEASRPKDISISRVHLRGVFEQHLVSEVLPLVEEELEGLSSLLNASEVELRESVEVVTYSLEAELSLDEQKPPEELKQAALEGFDRALQKLARYEEELGQKVASSKEQLDTIFQKALDRFRGALQKVSTVESARSWVRILVGSFWDKVNDRYQDWTVTVTKRFGGVVKNLRGLWQRGVHLEGEEWQLTGESDAGSLREYVKKQTHFPQDEDLPAVYRKLFSLDPLRDRRFFVVNRHVLDLVRQVERGWRDGAPTSGLLVHGSPGTGRTSLLNVCQLELVTDRVIRLDDSLISRSRGLMTALATELLTNNDIRMIGQRLKERNTVLLIDNLDDWIRADPEGLNEMREICNLMVSTLGRVLWLVTIKSINVELFDRLFSTSSIFSHRAELGVLDTAEIQSVVETRHRVSGMNLEFEHTWGPSWLGRLGVLDPSSVFFRVLADASGGNLRHALHLWVESLSRSQLDNNRLRPTLNRMSRPEVDFLASIPRASLAVVAELIRFGASDTNELIERLRVRGVDFHRQMQFLEMAGLVERKTEGRESFEVPVQAKYLIYRSLRAAGVL